MAAFVTRLEMDKGLNFRAILGEPAEFEDEVFGREGAIAEADFGFVTFLEIAGPFDPFWFGFGKFVSVEGDHFSDAAGGSNASLTVDGSEFEDEGVTVAGGKDAFAIVVGAVDGSGADADGVLTAMGNSALLIEGEEAEVASSVVSSVEVGIGSFGDEAEASSEEEFWKIFRLFTLEVEGGGLGVVF